MTIIHITYSSVHFPHILLHFLTSDVALVLILENACLFHASQTQPDRAAALDVAYSRYNTSDTHIAATNEFSAPSVEYSIPQFAEFILAHRLR
jgi:hypothetical protein